MASTFHPKQRKTPEKCHRMQNRGICAVSIRSSMQNTAGNSRNRYRRSRSDYTTPERLTDTKPPKQVKSDRPPNRYQKQRRQNTSAGIRSRYCAIYPNRYRRIDRPQRRQTDRRNSPHDQNDRARWIFRARYGVGDDRRTWSSSDTAGIIPFCAFCDFKILHCKV